MTARHYLFGFSGRINRGKIWRWVLIVFVATIVAIVIAAFGFDWTAAKASIVAQKGQHFIDYSKVAKPGCKGTVSLLAMIALGLIVVAYIWGTLAVYAKRLHDRGRSAWWLLVYLGVPAILHGIACHSLVGPNAGMGPHPLMLHNLTLLGQIAYWTAVVIGFWVFIDLYCLKGSKGENKYGADPLEPNWCDPEKPEKGCVERPKAG